MLCEECQKNQATVMMTVTAGEQITTRHLCKECMENMEIRFAHGDVQGFLSSILSMLSAQSKAAARTCSGCGLSYAEFKETGRLGCAQCYHDFADELRPLLLRVHGRSQHAGRVPASIKEDFNRLQQINHLRDQMEKAVSIENFEEAAKLRDEIHALSEMQEDSERI